MSLIITSNEIAGKQNQIGEFQSPYSWSNHLNQPIKIPPHSEVAVQSLKINKDGTISINPALKWYVYYGKKLVDGTVSYENTTSAPHIVDLKLTTSEEVTVEQFAQKIKNALDRGLPTPETFGLSDCVAVRNASGTDFQGFTFSMQTRTNGSGLNNIPQTWDNVFSKTYPTAGLTFNSASNTLTPKAQYVDRKGAALFNVAIGQDTPLSTNGGEYIMNLSNVAKTGWAVGLRRCVTSKNRQITKIFSKRDSDLDLNHFSDFVVYAIQDNIGVQNNAFKIRVYQSTTDSSRTTNPNLPLQMREVDYTTGNGSLTGIYNWSTNASNDNYDKIKFTVNNELVKVELHNASGWDLLVSDSAGGKGERFNPVRDTCRNLYPLAFCTNNASNNSYLTIEKWGGRVINSFTYNNPDNDWYAYLANFGLLPTIRELENREIFNYASATVPDYEGINASGVPENYEFVMVLKSDTQLYTGTERANIARYFGFENVVRLDSSDKSGSNLEIQSYKSNETPNLKSTSSIFVRLNNLPVRSYNAGQSRRSQIIYSAPRFATGTDQQVGALFFESPEKTYVSLDNPMEINLNTIDIDIVNESETLATDLLGKTVCTLHIRQSPKM